ncbi:MAG: HPP family protein [Gammaproteobacteria bacterium]|nr:HPP family protein [Gammaproteobacteria bacterium]
MKRFIELLGIQLDTTPHKEKFISAIGGFIGIFLILQITHHFVGAQGAALIVASMGASAVLLFAVPHGPLSQPWPLVGGHVISACIGVSCRLLIPDMFVAGAVAVGVSIGAMYYLRCIHPPGGASALAAVVSGPEVHALGFMFVITPVLFNALVILCAAILVNYPFDWRRYPTALAEVYRPKQTEKEKHGQLGRIPRKDLEYALKSMRSFADISEEELEKIYETATEHGRATSLSSEDIKLGHYYLHGKNDDTGVIRRIIDASEDNKDMIIYKVITGPDRKKTESTTRAAFARWAKHEVVFENNEWKIKPD